MAELIFKSIGIERLRVVSDGDGITTLVAGYGCTLRCKYCLNPQCFESAAKTFTVDELINEVAIDNLYFQATNGGITFGGGEPLLQADFIHEFRKQCPKEWNMYLESSLAVPTQNLEKVIDDIDWYLVDCKDMARDIYRNYTGKENDLTIKNLALLAERGLVNKVKVRIPLIPEYNTEADQKNSVEVLKGMGFENFDLFEYDKPRALKKRSFQKGDSEL